MPSVGCVALTGRNARAEINKLLNNKRQVAYWGLTETELVQLTMSKDKVASLHAMLQVKAFVSRNAAESQQSHPVSGALREALGDGGRLRRG